MKKIIALLTLALIATLFTGCGAQAPVKITNDLGAWNIEEVYVDPSSDPWGENLITEIMVPGDEFTVNVSPGTYDLKVIDEDGDSYTLYLVEIPAEGFNWVIDLDGID